MNETFNLVTAPWLPCRSPGGEMCELSLHEALDRAHELTSLEGETPPETAALLRLLLAVLHRVVDTSSLETWASAWEAGRFPVDGLRAYFDHWRDRFDLFDPVHPFYQVHHNLVDPKAAVKLQPGMLSAGLYYHAVETGECRYTPAQAARLLVTAQAFATPGICHPQKKLFFSGGPWLAGKVFFLEGDTLFQTLMLNLLPYSSNHPRPNLDRTSADAPAWERDDPFAPARTRPLGYLDYLTWPNRRALLLPVKEDGYLWVREVIEAPGMKLEGEFFDPMKVFTLKNEKEGFKLLYLNQARSLWRESATFLNVANPQRVRPPAALEWAAALIDEDVLPRTVTFRMMTVGMVVESQSKILLHRQERMPLPLRLLTDPALFAQLAQEVQNAEATRNKLYYATNILASFILSYRNDFPEGRKPRGEDIQKLMAHWNWEGAYWPELELPFFSFVQDLAAGDEQAVVAWRSTLQHTAWASLETAIRSVGDTPAALKAAVQARGALAGGLKKLELLPRAEPAADLNL